MFFKKSLKKLEKKIKPLIEKEDYYAIRVLYEENGYKELAERYHNLAVKKIRESNILSRLKDESVLPLEECNIKLMEDLYSIPQDWIDKELIGLSNYIGYEYNNLEKYSAEN